MLRAVIFPVPVRGSGSPSIYLMQGACHIVAKRTTLYPGCKYRNEHRMQEHERGQGALMAVNRY
jgi:predicted GIY-YIG superfamily endonuclease